MTLAICWFLEASILYKIMERKLSPLSGRRAELTHRSTEIGRIMTSFRPPGDTEWDYLRLAPPISDNILMDEIAPGVFECVALEGLSTRTAVNTDNPPNSFRSRDLFAPHPSRPNLWKYLARLDDRLTLVNGEKVLPLPMEGRIRQDRLV